jgi:tetratricopeptide (TPR) repeat protein
VIRSRLILLFVTTLAARGTLVSDAYEKGKADLDGRRFADADREFAQAEAGAPGATNALALRAKALIQLSRFREAQLCLRQYLQTHPQSADAWYLLGFVQFRLGDPADSLATYTEAARRKRPAPDDLKIVGLDYALLNDYATACKWLELAVSSDPNNAEAVYHLGRIYYVQNQFDKAIVAFQQALRIDPSYAKAEAYLGLSYAAKNDPAEAERAYRRAIEMNAAAPAKTPEPYIDLADLISHGENRKEALPLLDQAEHIGGKSARTEEIRGRIFLASNRLVEAETEVRSALAADPQNSSLHYLLGRVLKKEGKDGEAEREFARTRDLLASRSPETN